MNSEKKLQSIVPYELTNRPVSEIIGNRQLTVEGCKGIEEYTEVLIKVKTTDGTLAAYGSDLNIKLLSTSAVIVGGVINRVEFEDWR